jgi:hypothetical protein
MLPNTPAILEELIRGLTDAELARKPGRDRFSIGEVIAHLEHAERTLYGPRIRAIIDADTPRLPAYKAPTDGFGGRAVRTTLESYARERTANSKLLDSVEGDDLKRTGIHEMYGPLTLENVISEIAYHDLGHIKQVSELVRWLRYHPRMGPFQKDYSVNP